MHSERGSARVYVLAYAWHPRHRIDRERTRPRIGPQRSVFTYA